MVIGKKLETIIQLKNPYPSNSAIRDAISDFIEEYKYRCGCNYMECIRGISPSIGIYNVYGRIVHKKAKGCAHNYV